MNEKEFLRIVRPHPVFTTVQVSAIIGDRPYSRVYLHRMMERGVIRRLKRGLYTVHDDPLIYATHIYYPSYISLWHAFQHHGTTTQLPEVIEVMARRNGTLQNIEFIKTRYMYGYQKIRYRGFEVFMADIEKAVLDAVITERVPVDEVQNAFQHCDVKKLEDYALRTDPSTMKRMGYVAELSGFFMKRLYQRVKKDRNYVRFYAACKKNRWRVIGD